MSNEVLIEEARKKAEAERDAALAAVERVRAMHRPESNERYTWCVGCSTDEYPEDWPCPTIAALDGAPEPDGQWEYRARTDYGRVVAQGSLDEIGSLSGHIWERRRKAGPWVPVEGEKP